VKPAVWRRLARAQTRLVGEALAAGVDEAGRGPLAGPVVAAAVVLSPGGKWNGLDDSKKVDAARREAIESHVTIRAPGTRRLGIAWAGSPHHGNDRRRSIPLAALAPLFALPGIDWYSLQKGAASAQLAQVGEAHAVVPLDVDCHFADTAALVDALDAVVTVDTSIAHLAGALGKPVFVLLPYAPDWRWGIAGDRTPWYPSARLFRQPAVGDWRSVIASLRESLAARDAFADAPTRY